MADGVLFLASPLALALFGLPAAWASPVRGFSAAARVSAAFVTGSVAFTIWLTLLSTAGIAWSAASVVLPLGALSVAGAVVAARRARVECPAEDETGTVAWVAGFLALGAGSAHLVLAALTSRATSIDYLYFWGVKAIRFAEHGGIDAALLSHPFAAHMHSNYPPLVPIVYAWGIEVAGRLPWQFGLVSYAVWILAGTPLLHDLFARRMGRDEATLAVSFWFLAFALALPAALSAGNAEPAVVLFASVAVAGFLAGGSEWLGTVALAGLILTKNEGLIVAGLIAGGVIAREVFARERAGVVVRRGAAVLLPMLAAWGVWLTFGLVQGVPMRDATREQAGTLSLASAGDVAVEMARHLDAGSAGIAWLVAAGMLVYARRRWRELLPSIVPAAGVLAFLFVYYLHYRESDLEAWVRWTMPRVSLSALAAALVGAAFAGAVRRSARD